MSCQSGAAGVPRVEQTSHKRTWSSHGRDTGVTRAGAGVPGAGDEACGGVHRHEPLQGGRVDRA
eukprot:418877-Pyramimonas_sp.AAC.1